ncbi:glycosyltransferase family 4 protein [Candidatus Gottesmanbacteria bacterium]|nr:glycosyltransferase family 4 protein [Candidatus Gottesmanbacteria bacterium]
MQEDVLQSAMIIAIDGYEANVPERVGIGRYAYEILKQMFEEVKSRKSKVESEDKIDFRIYLPSTPLSDMPSETQWWQYRVLEPKKFWTLFRLPLALATDLPKADVVFSPTHYLPRFTHLPRVMSIMDVSYLHYPGLFRPQDLYQLTHWTAYSVAHAARILTISEFSKNAIIKAYGVSEEHIVVTYPGLSNHKSQITMTKQNVVRKYQLSNHYILSVGTLQPRKNFVRLIEAFAGFLKANKQRFGDIDLVIVGKKGWLYEEILAAPVKFGVANRVKFLDFVSDEDLVCLYEHALCFALPSLYEGFGLPVLEAMARKIPVVVSRVSSLPEIAGKAAVYVDPENTESITKGLLSAVRDRNLLQGRYRVNKGLEQVRKFTWENAARRTLEVLEEVAEST